MTKKQRKLEDLEKKSQERREWQTKKLEEVAHINLGQSPKGEYYNEEGDGPHFIQGSKNFGDKYPELERFCSEPKREADEGDVLISVRAPVGPVNIAPEKLCIGRGVTALRLNEGSNEYLFYFLKYFEDKWSQFADGTTFNSITKSDLQNLELPYPPKDERNKIAFILRKLDEKIENNNQINEILEELVQTLFKSRFVDYEPYEQFKDVEIGEIPENFEILKIGDVCSTRGGGTPSTENDEYWNGDNLWLTPKEVTSLDSKIVFDTERKVSDEGLNNSSTAIMPVKSVLLTSRATVGEVVVNREPMGTNQGFICIQPNGRIEPYYLACLVENKRPEIENRASGSTYDEISQTSFNGIQVAVPPKEDIEEFENKVEDIYEDIYTRELENRRLEELRDTLLPKLMSGEIRVDDIKLDELKLNNEV
ncbi:hypothetical protein DM867_05665 [Halosegnis rubeus]|uniref:Type I restriction modification DNA specificity domain-containing protein n=1 Tax=Halosegnis rubeus TaxID=2212850 RepID=A0A5N5U7I4_9EURY|nr:restriction endonuclease subunit S [Halosegnis rubeus]KAB7514606.1 hypothetical protein DM867_05665 [Halosegnis rubeus]